MAMHQKVCCWSFTEVTGDHHATPSCGASREVWISSNKPASVRLRSAWTARKSRAIFHSRQATLSRSFRIQTRKRFDVTTWYTRALEKMVEISRGRQSFWLIRPELCDGST